MACSLGHGTTIHLLKVKLAPARSLSSLRFVDPEVRPSTGAFAFFGPGQFGNLYTSLTRSCGQGRLHMAGEALSPRHAWIVGALDASWRAVYNIVLSDYKDQKENFEKKWGKDEEWIPSAQFQKAMEELSGGKSKDQSYDLFMVLREV